MAGDNKERAESMKPMDPADTTIIPVAWQNTGLVAIQSGEVSVPENGYDFLADVGRRAQACGFKTHLDEINLALNVIGKDTHIRIKTRDHKAFTIKTGPHYVKPARVSMAAAWLAVVYFAPLMALPSLFLAAAAALSYRSKQSIAEIDKFKGCLREAIEAQGWQSAFKQA